METALALDQEQRQQEVMKKWTSLLPKNYNFEIEKTIQKIQQTQAKVVGLQFPEGLLMFSTAISDILLAFCPSMKKTVILGDVTYGACCIDDFNAKALGCDLLVHYAHSCLIPVNQCLLKNILYVFVDIQVDLEHCVATVKHNFKPDDKVVLVGTIQFVSSLRAIKPELDQFFKQEVNVPQIKPLSPGEILGCTSPKLDQFDVLLYIADGRFHLESIMISNPHLKAFKYDPYSKKITEEGYNHEKMHSIRKEAIGKAKNAKKYGIILGTLGRQGSPKILERLQNIMKQQGKEYVTVLLSEIFPKKLELFRDVDAWIQIACPRLSIDWGYAFDKPLLTPYEAEVALETTEWKEVYPMDFYAHNGGSWTVYYDDNKKSSENTESLSKEEKKQRMKEKLQQLKAQKSNLN